MEPQSFWQLVFSFSQIGTFFWIFAIGAGFTLVTFIFGELFDGVEDVFHGVFDFLHVDQFFHFEGDGGGPSVFSPRVISVFVTIFGGAGFLASSNKIGPIASSLIGMVSGFVIASLFFLIFRWIYSQQSSSVINNSSLVGSRGIVKTGIPVGGVGEVIVDYVGSRITKPAKSINGEMIQTDKNVNVKEVRGQMLIVECEK